jgi:nitrogen fixation/metabolism regulation signal transduction histidine kinase
MKIRTMMVISFLFVAAFTPALTILTQQAVADTNQQARETIDQSLMVIDSSKQAFDSSEKMLENLENIREYQDQGDIPASINEAEDLSQNFRQFNRAYENLSSSIDEDSSPELKAELTRMRQARNNMQTQITYTMGSVRTGSTISSATLENFRSDFQQVATASATINAQLIEEQTSNLEQLHVSLKRLSDNIVLMGVSVMFIAFAIAIYGSIRLSEPIKELSREAEKIKNEELDDVNLSDIHTRADELQEFKEVLGEMVLALKAEFERDRTEMNQLGLDIADVLSEEVPRATAESSLASACKKLGIDPMEIREKHLDDLAEQLEISMAGLNPDERVFDEMRELKEQ